MTKAERIALRNKTYKEPELPERCDNCNFGRAPNGSYDECDWSCELGGSYTTKGGQFYGNDKFGSCEAWESQSTLTLGVTNDEHIQAER